jgi:hypothetical protein
MKTGILTYHRSHNYGAVLQAYALKTYISSSGYEVEFVDYWPKYHEDMYALWSWNKFWHVKTKSKLKMLLSFFITFRRKYKRRKLFLDFIDTYIVPKNLRNMEVYDLVIYGSDQIWRYQRQYSYKGYNDIYFGSDDIKAKRRISFSASMGNVNTDNDTVLFLKKGLKNFDALSVRETDLRDVIQPLTGLKVYHTLDPVFLLDERQWNNLSAPRQITGGYILLYNLQSDITAYNIAKKLSALKRLPVTTLKGRIPLINGKNNRGITGPKEFISLIKHADIVVSSSFHGLAFSILFRKEFYISQNRNTGRVKSLLNSIGLDDNFVTDISKLEHIKSIDYNEVNKKLDEYKKISTEYLKSELEIVHDINFNK